MAILGNSGGNNRGKKYIKLRGDETATPENQAAADAFCEWFGQNVDRIRTAIARRVRVDDDLLSETFLKMYDGIALKGFQVRDYYSYFRRSYFTNVTAAAWKTRPTEYSTNDGSKEALRSQPYGVVCASLRRFIDEDNPDEPVDPEGALCAEIMSYVEATYDPAAVSLFEMYVRRYPEASYAKLARLTGLPINTVWQAIAPIKKDLQSRFNAFPRV